MSYHSDKKIKDYYKMEEELGRGTFAIVRKAIHRKTGLEYAVKEFDKQHLDEDEQENLHLEVNILSEIDHPNVVKLFEIFDEGTRLYLVMELMQGGELFDRIVEKEAYSEREAAECLKPLVDGIRYCHELGIIHRDLKPENLLYESSDQASIIKISDFGLARYVENELATTACGTPGYVAPEIISGEGYGKEVDYWSIGIILYTMLCGFPPFYEENNQILFDKIKSCDFNFPSPYWDQVSDEVKDLIKKILVNNPKERLNAEEILNHSWVTGEERKEDVKLSEVPKKLKDYKARIKFKKAGLVVLAVNKLNKGLSNIGLGQEDKIQNKQMMIDKLNK